MAVERSLPFHDISWKHIWRPSLQTCFCVCECVCVCDDDDLLVAYYYTTILFFKWRHDTNRRLFKVPSIVELFFFRQSIGAFNFCAKITTPWNKIDRLFVRGCVGGEWIQQIFSILILNNTKKKRNEKVWERECDKSVCVRRAYYLRAALNFVWCGEKRGALCCWSLVCVSVYKEIKSRQVKSK